MLNKNAGLWIEALRSGEYKQGRGALREWDKFCCLGVACELYQREVGGLSIEILEPFRSYNRLTLTLPEPVKDWLKLNSTSGSYGDRSLTVDNDSGRTFEEIADIIESEPLGLFRKEENAS